MADHDTHDHTGVTGVPDATNPNPTTIELGHASDTTLSRASAGVVAVEGTNLVKAGAATGSGLTMATSRLLGRTTASTGAIEEITVGSGLSLSAGDLTATGVSHVTFTIGPWYIPDLPGTASTNAQLAFFNTSTAIGTSSGTGVRITPACHIIGAILASDADRTAGTATLQVSVAGTPTAFDGGSVVLDGTNVDRISSFVAHASGVAAGANATIGVTIVTSGWTPTTANIVAWLIVSLD